MAKSKLEHRQKDGVSRRNTRLGDGLRTRHTGLTSRGKRKSAQIYDDTQSTSARTLIQIVAESTRDDTLAIVSARDLAADPSLLRE